jgi:hypothetical protein
MSVVVYTYNTMDYGRTTRIDTSTLAVRLNPNPTAGNYCPTDIENNLARQLRNGKILKFWKK